MDLGLAAVSAPIHKPARMLEEVSSALLLALCCVVALLCLLESPACNAYDRVAVGVDKAFFGSFAGVIPKIDGLVLLVDVGVFDMAPKKYLAIIRNPENVRRVYGYEAAKDSLMARQKRKAPSEPLCLEWPRIATVLNAAKEIYLYISRRCFPGVLHREIHLGTIVVEAPYSKVSNTEIGPKFFSGRIPAVLDKPIRGESKSKGEDNKRGVSDLKAFPEHYVSLGGLLTAMLCVVVAFLVAGRDGYWTAIGVFLLFEATVGLLLGIDLWSLAVYLLK